LAAETKYGGTVTNVKRKRIPDGGSGYSKTTTIWPAETVLKNIKVHLWRTWSFWSNCRKLAIYRKSKVILALLQPCSCCCSSSCSSCSCDYYV